MKNRIMPSIVVVLSMALSVELRGDSPSPRNTTPELNKARRTGWQLALVVIRKLEAGDQKNPPGIQAWLKDLRKVAKSIDLEAGPDRWPAIDTDALLTRNPNFWQAYYEIAPGDPGLMLLEAGLLLSAGEAVRASHVIVVAGQRPGIPKELQQALKIILAHCQKVREKPNALVLEGIKLHDQGDYAGALKKYKDALALWPQNGFAHYEVGLTLHHQQLVAAGEEPPPLGSVTVNSGEKFPPEVDVAYAKARHHDPLQLKAYQGDNREAIRGLLALVKKGMPAWQELVKNRKTRVDDEVLEQLGGACQQANIHELALATRQILVARRGRYAPADHPFISTSLRKLAPGEQTEAVLQRLARGKLRLRLLVAPKPSVP